MPGIQTIIVIIIVACAALFCAWKIKRIITNPDDACGCTGTCPLADPTQCSNNNEEEEPPS